MTPETPPAVELCLAEDLGSVAVAREAARDLLARSGYQGAHDEVLLVVSELVTNALVHGGGMPVVRLGADASRIRIEVCDDSPHVPKVGRPGPCGGWGMNVVKLLSQSWGAVRRDGGKVVWCELVAWPAPVAATAPRVATAA